MFMFVAFLKFEGLSRFGLACAPSVGTLPYLTGELKLASPKLTSANAHQITTFDTFFT